MIWTTDKIFLSALFCGLLLSIIITLSFFNKKGEDNKKSETFDSLNKKFLVIGAPFGDDVTEKISKQENIILYDMIEYLPLAKSENMRPVDWVRIGMGINKHYDSYSGFLVTHSVDTLAYTSSALAFMLENLDKTVVVTADDCDNIINSLLFLSKHNVAEVVVCYEKRIFKGCCTTFKNNKIYSPDYDFLKETKKEDSEDPFTFTPINPNKIRIIAIKLFPGITAQFINNVTKGEEVHSIVIETYSDGNTPADKNFIEKIAYLVRVGVTIVLVSNNKEKKPLLEQIGAINVNMTPEAAMAKLYFILSNLVGQPPKELIAQLMCKNMRGEIMS